MTLRAKSRSSQFMRWLGAALVALTAFVVISVLLYGSVSFDILDPSRYRLVLPIVVAFGVFAWETRWDGVVRKDDEEEDSATVALPPQDAAEGSSPQGATESSSPQSLAETTAHRQQVEKQQEGDIPSEGEALYNQARSLPHRVIPDFDADRRYLELLCRSSALGFSPASVKLGEYAMRRKTWVEAYYWMSLAKRQGMGNLSSTLRSIRTTWAVGGSHNESFNVNEFFTEEAGSIGRAVLRIDSGHNSTVARQFLANHHPEWLSQSHG